HLPEIIAHTGLTRRPIFVPSVGNFPQGMVVSVPLHLNNLKPTPSLADLNDAFEAHYGGETNGKVRFRHTPDANDIYETGRLIVDPAVDDEHLDIWLFGDKAHNQAVIVARLDNLGKGAAGAAVQNLELMLGA
ncbi:MAG: N-acetyl-gamma-glutamyl-phosphate reductase, partial [Pseudomonadota bacterium]